MTIRDFEESIDRVILGRGYEYYEDDHINDMYQEADGTIYFLVFLYRQVDMRLPHLAQRPLLSISSNFFSSRFSISNIFSLCLSCSISICACSSSVLGF